MPMTRTIAAVLAVLACASLASAQAGNPVATEAKQSDTNVENNLLAMAEKMPEEHDMAVYLRLTGLVPPSSDRR